METKDFHVSDVLSITTGRLLSTRHMEGIYDILNFMTNDDLMTHQLPRAMEQCQPFIFEQHPQLKNLSVDEFETDDGVRNWVEEQGKKFGHMLKIEQIPSNKYEHRDPIKEAVEMCGAEKIMVVPV
jgi:hypothetical protein